VGAGTFLPVRTDDLDDHAMHSEWFSVSEELASEIAAARLRGAPVIAVGTTVVRALESARDQDQPGHVLTRAGQTRLLIQPGYEFGVVDALLTNFHAPRSTLLALVSAFIGNRRREAAYRIALEQGFRFLSYGDAMWLPARLGRGLVGDLTGNLRISRG
jgi:S-adenosylmethionine:tRNA ribosyltransferase-isomerase